MNVLQRFRPEAGLTFEDEAAAAKPLSSGDKAADKARVAEMAEQIAELQDRLYAEQQRKLLVILQGMDTSGKDGTVKGVFGRIDPLGVRAVGFKAPSGAEKARDYLWRVHQQVPAQGEIVIFNRSHYEDVLVPLVHGAIDKAECERRYAHIRDFERMLVETGTVVLKFFLHISKDEQKQRLAARLADSDKHWKFDPQDLKERAFWAVYQDAYRRALRATDTPHAPWHVIPADSKTHRNLAVAAIVLETLQQMGPRFPPAAAELSGLRVD